jgi:hypothetical protein
MRVYKRARTSRLGGRCRVRYTHTKTSEESRGFRETVKAALEYLQLGWLQGILDLIDLKKI